MNHSVTLRSRSHCRLLSPVLLLGAVALQSYATPLFETVQAFALPSIPAKLLKASDGNLYGTTMSGGDSIPGYGTVFKLAPTGTLTTLVNFTGANGSSPMAGLVQGSDGNFYGTTGGSGCVTGA